MAKIYWIHYLLYIFFEGNNRSIIKNITFIIDRLNRLFYLIELKFFYFNKEISKYIYYN